MKVPARWTAREECSKGLPIPLSWLLALFSLALSVRLAAFFVHGRSLAFLKYPRAAALLDLGELGTDRLHDFSPLYLQVHRVLLVLGVESLDPLRLIQCLLGSLSVILVARLAARALGPRLGLLAGLLLAVQVDMVLYDQVLEPEALLLFLTVLAATFHGLDGTRCRLGLFAAAGVAAGLAAATRPTAWLVLGVLLAVEGVAFFKDRDPRRLLGGALLILAAVLAQGTAARWALPSAGRPVMSPWQVLYTGNNPQATGLWRHDFLVKDLEDQGAVGAPDWAHQVFRDVAVASGGPVERPDEYWKDRVLAFWGAYPGAAATLGARKLLALGQHHDPDDIDTVFRLRRRLASWPLLPAWLLVGLGFAGLVVAGRRLRWFAALVGAQAAVCALFFVSARYRLPILPWMGVSAAAWIGLLATALRQIRRPVAGGSRWASGVLICLAAGALSLGLFWAPLPPGPGADRHIREIRRVHGRYSEGWQLREANDLVGASGALGDCLAWVPWERALLPIPEVPFPVAALAEARLGEVREEAKRTETAWDRLRLATLLELAGHLEEAGRGYRLATAAAWRPSDQDLEYRALVSLGRVELLLGGVAEAKESFLRASNLRPGDPLALVGLATASPESGALGEALRVNPRLEVLYLQGRFLLEVGRSGEAIGPLSALSEALPGYARARLLLASALSRVGQHPAAVRQALAAQTADPGLVDPDFGCTEIFERASRVKSAPPVLHRYTAWAATREGRLEEALTAWTLMEQRSELSPGDRGRIGVLLLRHGQAAQALPYLQAAIAEDPEDAVAAAALTAARRRLEDSP